MTKFKRAGLPALLALALLSAPALAQTEAPPAAATPAAPAADTSPGAPGKEPERKFDLPRAGDKNSQPELITGLCEVQMKSMTPLGCRCLADQAMTTLSDPQRDYLIATVVAPPVAERMLNDGRVGQLDQQTIFTFINATSDACASGTFDAAKAKAMTPAAPMAAPKPVPTPPAAAPAPLAPAAPAN